MRTCTLGKYVAQKLVWPKYFLPKFVTQEFCPPFFPPKEMVNIFARKEIVNQVGSKHYPPSPCLTEVVTLSLAVTKWAADRLSKQLATNHQLHQTTKAI